MTSSLHARRIFVALAGLLAAISFLKALRLPNRWVATNFVLNYSQGFVRRGLARRALGERGADLELRSAILVFLASPA